MYYNYDVAISPSILCRYTWKCDRSTAFTAVLVYLSGNILEIEYINLRTQ